MKQFTKFEIQKDAVSSIVLFCSVLAALFLSNHGDYIEHYRAFINAVVNIGFGSYELSKPLVKFVNDGLMAIFFFLLGLEMKYHIVEGEFKNKKSLFLPTLGAVGGFIVPALIYYAVNHASAEGRVGWAIPVATDTAFVLAILALLKSKVSDSLKVFVIGLSIIDDVLAVLTLAFFYTPNLNPTELWACLMPLASLFILNYRNSTNRTLYYVSGIVLWAMVVKTGIHGTIAGIVLSFFIPTQVEKPNKTINFIKDIESSIHTFVAFVVLPLFAFVNCELSFNELDIKDIFSNISLGSLFGLFLGKPIGIMGVILIARFFKVVELPRGANLIQVTAVACLSGVGFTLSLFIGLQAFDTVALENQMKTGVLLGSLASIILGVLIFVIWVKQKPYHEEPTKPAEVL
jgi:NhaA family Na+:H+ antiporter